MKAGNQNKRMKKTSADFFFSEQVEKVLKNTARMC